MYCMMLVLQCMQLAGAAMHAAGGAHTQAHTGSHAFLCKLQESGSSCMFERARVLCSVYCQYMARNKSLVAVGSA